MLEPPDTVLVAFLAMALAVRADGIATKFPIPLQTDRPSRGTLCFIVFADTPIDNPDFGIEL